ncbi:MAG: ParB N-terminal domain-containing protein [Hyphomicrobiaceae bacterium]
MGLIKKDLVRIKLPDREAHNSRMFVDLCENIHIHHREFRVVFSLDEYLEFVDVLGRSTEDVLSYLAQNPDYEEGIYPTTIMVAGGKERQRKLLLNSPAPNQSAYFANDFAIELQEESVVDEIHVHWRDYRFAMNRENFKIIAEAFSEAKKGLLQFEAENHYVRRPHHDRSMKSFEYEFSEYNSYETRIMGEEMFPIASIKSRFDEGSESFSPPQDLIGLLVQKYKTGQRVVPIILSTEANGDHIVIDGNHRFHAAQRAGLTEINCIVMDVSFGDSEPFRCAEGLLKKFDESTGYRYNTSGFTKHFIAHRASRYYVDHFHSIARRSGRRRAKLKFRHFRRKVKQELRNLFGGKRPFV